MTRPNTEAARAEKTKLSSKFWIVLPLALLLSAAACSREQVSVPTDSSQTSVTALAPIAGHLLVADQAGQPADVKLRDAARQFGRPRPVRYRRQCKNGRAGNQRGPHRDSVCGGRHHRARLANRACPAKMHRANRIFAEGKGKTQPVTKPGDCKGPKSKKVIACLQPDRRVDIEIIGTKAE